MSPTNNDTGLRRDVADYIEGHYRDRAEALQVADAILAIPEIAEALRFVEGSPGFTATVQTAIAKG